MIVQVRIEPETLEKIRKLIDDGHYKNIYDFVGMAIENQIRLDFSEESSLSLYNAIEANPKLAIPRKIEFEIAEIMLPKLETKSNRDIQYEVYGPGTSGLIWIFQNRFFPVKVALQSLSNIIKKENSDSVEFDLWETYAGGYALDISSRLFDSDIRTEITTGLPIPKQKVGQKFSKKKNRDVLITQKLEATKKRFVEQFVGRKILKESKEYDVVFSGACFEMGLVTIKEYKEPLNPKITLTRNGLEFLKLQNPIFEMLKSANTVDQNAFSRDEVKFVKDKIISKFELEEKIVNTILELKTPKISSQDIKDIFINTKREYFENLYVRNTDGEKMLAEIGRKYESDIRKIENGNSQRNVINWIVKRYSEFQTITIIGRLIELDLVKREYIGREPVYYNKKNN